MIETANRDIVDGLAKALIAKIPEWYGVDASLDLKAIALHTYPYSFFVSFPVQTPSGKQTLFAKIHRKPHMETLKEALAADWLRPIAHAEYEITKVIWQTFESKNSPVCTAIQPLGLADEWNAILMRKVEGKELKKFLVRPSVLFRSGPALMELQKYLEASMIWLRIFHDHVSEAQMAPFPVDDALESMDEILEKLKQCSNAEVDVEFYRNELLNRLESIRDLTVPVALLHDDFQYSNILIQNDGRACVLDYAFNHRGCVYSDLATFLIDPQTRGVQILTRGIFIAPAFLHAFRTTALTAYFNGEGYHKDVLDFYCLLAILNKWSADEGAIYSGWKRRLYSFFVPSMRHYYTNLLTEYF
ncbi:MAG TPA: phosphotransferase [Anaerolineales bacterium]|nr:phosphotransferase [Anaerolineales bacterium]